MPLGGGLFDEFFRHRGFDGLQPITINFLVKPIDLRMKQVVGPAAEATIEVAGFRISNIGITVFQTPGQLDQARVIWPAHVRFANTPTEMLWERRIIEAFVRSYTDKSAADQQEIDKANLRALPWKTLGLGGPTDEATARAAYRKAARVTHPDLVQDQTEKASREKQFKSLGEAWEKICKAMGWA